MPFIGLAHGFIDPIINAFINRTNDTLEYFVDYIYGVNNQQFHVGTAACMRWCGRSFV